MTELIDENELYDLAEIFKVFGDSTRIRIMFALCDEEKAVSHQLKILKQSKLVKAKRIGKQIYYSLADQHVKTIIAMGREHIEE